MLRFMRFIAISASVLVCSVSGLMASVSEDMDYRKVAKIMAKLPELVKLGELVWDSQQHGAISREDAYKEFFKGKLVYRPTPGNDEGKVEFNILSFVEDMDYPKAAPPVAQLQKVEQVDKLVWDSWHGVIGHESSYEAFLKGKLVYRPTPGSDEGKIEFSISSFPDPFKITFDLSLCGDSARWHRITTDPAVFFKYTGSEGGPSINILIAPHFLINRYIDSVTKLFGPVMKNWDAVKAPVGIFWRWAFAAPNSYQSLTSSSLAMICSNDLHKNWESAEAFPNGRKERMGDQDKFFMFICDK